MHLVVTVGSTLFQSLTDKILSPAILDTLPSFGITTITVQYGTATLTPLNQPRYLDLQFDQAGNGTFTWTSISSKRLLVKVIRFTDDFNGLIESSSAVISHAGSGSILTVLRKKDKPLLIVPNTSLMDNHQAELAIELERQGYLTVSTVEELPAKIKAWLRKGVLRDFPPVQPDRFRGIMDELMGFN